MTSKGHFTFFFLKREKGSVYRGKIVKFIFGHLEMSTGYLADGTDRSTANIVLATMYTSTARLYAIQSIKECLLKEGIWHASQTLRTGEEEKQRWFY